MFNYKIEKKPTTWQIGIDRGSYSDYDEMYYFVSANSSEEAWFFFKKFLENAKPDWYESNRVFYKNEVLIGDKWLDNKFNTLGDSYDDSSDWEVQSIEMLEVMHIHEL